MKALSLWQPWASLMAIGVKTIETRHWATDYRGLVVIHAAKKWTRELYDITFTEPFKSALESEIWDNHHTRLDPNVLPLGSIVAVGELVACRVIPDRITLAEPERSFGDYSPGRFGWIFRNVRRLAETIPLRGQQGLWTLEPAIVERIEREVSAIA